MSTPKPGQIRCPTCLRSTPPAAFCTQCGSPIPASARVRPRGMDRDELEERVRRRPGEGSIFRRGQQVEDTPASAGYVPFEPEPEDSLAVRPESGDSSVYQGPPRDASEDTQQLQRPAAPPQAPQPPSEPSAYAPPPPAPPPSAAPPPAAAPFAAPPPAAAAPARPEGPVPSQPVPPPPSPEAQGPASEEPYAAEPFDEYDDRPYGDPEDAYAYPYAAAEERGGGGGGGGALPIIGFVVLCVLALAVGAVLAGVFTGNETGQASPSPTATLASPTLEPTVEPTPGEPTAEPTTPATPEPTDGPITFPDGAVYTVQPCGTYEYRADLTGCKVDGTTRDNGNVWVLVVFDKAKGTDDLVLQLRSAGETLDRQEITLGSIVNCGDSCRGLIWGVSYKDLLAGEYQLVLRRNGDFADTATFTVGG